MDKRPTRRFYRTVLFVVAVAISATLFAWHELAVRQSPSVLLDARPDTRNPSRGITRLTGTVDEQMLAKAEAAIARGDKMIELESLGGQVFTGIKIAEELRTAHVKVRCVNWCASAAALIVIASEGCVVSPLGRIALHMSTDNSGSGWQAVGDALEIATWRRLHVPEDIIASTRRTYPDAYVLSDYAMRRIGCDVEPRLDWATQFDARNPAHSDPFHN